MRRRSWRWLGALVAATVAAGVRAADWTAWQPVPDKHQNGIDIRFKQGRSKNNGEYEWSYQFRNRYNRRLTGKIELVEEHADGPKRVTQTVTLGPNEQETKQEHRAVGRKITQAQAVDVQFEGGAAGPAPVADTPAVQQLRESVQKMRQEVERAEEERHQAELNAARVRALATSRTPQPSYSGTARVLGSTDQQMAEQMVRASALRVEQARRELRRLEDALKAATGQQTQGGDALAAAQKAASDGKWAEAEAAYRQVLKQDSNNALHLANLAVTLRNQGKLDDAVTTFRQAVQIEPDNAAYQAGLGRLYLEQGKPQQAQAAFAEAARLAPGEASYHHGLSVALINQNRPAEAEASAREALRLNAGEAKHYFALGAALVKQNKPAEAEKALREAARTEPGAVNHHAYLGLALSQQGKWAEAEKALREAAKLAPGVARHQANLGLALVNQEKWADAEAAYREAARLDPKNESYGQQLRSVQEKQGKTPQ